jgi:hypothetical protein
MAAICVTGASGKAGAAVLGFNPEHSWRDEVTEG